MQPISKLITQNENVLKRVPVARTLATRYLLRNRPLGIALESIPARYGQSYALISEKRSPEYRQVMNHMASYIGAGGYGPNKHWEYPWALKQLHLAPDLRVLDAGCGTAPVQYTVARLGCRLAGVDPNEGVQWHGINRNLAQRFGVDIEYRREGIESLTFEDNRFDRVYCVSVIEHCRAKAVQNERMTPQTEADRALQLDMMRQMVRVLKPGGLLVLTTDFNFPRSDCLLESNVDVSNLLSVAEAERVGEAHPIPMPGEAGFEPDLLIHDGDIDVSNHADILQTSIGFALRKL